MKKQADMWEWGPNDGVNPPGFAKVPEIRQETQFTCCAASIAACLQAHDKTQTEEDVNKVLNASPFRGASWEGILATIQYFGMRGSLVVPSTVTMLKSATDRGFPVLIAWNPRNRPWSHASVVFQVTGDPGSYMVHVMDPNLANPSTSTIVITEEDFYSKWYEKVSDEILVRRPGCVVEREVSKGGRQMRASLRTASPSRVARMFTGSWDDDDDHSPMGLWDSVAPNANKEDLEEMKRYVLQNRLAESRLPSHALEDVLFQMGKLGTTLPSTKNHWVWRLASIFKTNVSDAYNEGRLAKHGR